MMTKENIDIFLNDNEQIVQRIKRISDNYSITDFVKATEKARNYIKKSKDANVGTIYGCIYETRNRYLRLNNETVENRLTDEYLDYLKTILMLEEDVDVVFYVVAYHYLSMAKHMGYQLTGDYKAPFPFIGEEISPLAKKNYKIMSDTMAGNLYGVLNYFNEEDLSYYNKVYRECGYSHHATKHFSLIENLEGFSRIVNRYEFDNEFEKALNLFVFKYRAIYAEERLFIYMYREAKEQIISELIDL